MTCSLFSASLLRISCTARGERGKLSVLNPIAPHFFHRLKLRTPQGPATERIRGDATYTHQLHAFVSMVRGGPRMPTDEADAIANVRAIDAVYRKAGLKLRGT
jgi:predicted dehydrogenase